MSLAKERNHCILFSIFVLVHQYKFYKYDDMLDQMNICVLALHLENEAYNIMEIKNSKNMYCNV